MNFKMKTYKYYCLPTVIMISVAFCAIIIAITEDVFAILNLANFSFIDNFFALSSYILLWARFLEFYRNIK
jgi:hypothetical protein